MGNYQARFLRDGDAAMRPCYLTKIDLEYIATTLDGYGL